MGKGNRYNTSEGSLSPTDQALWAYVAGSITPLKKQGQRIKDKAAGPQRQTSTLPSSILAPPSLLPRHSSSREPESFDPHTLRQVRKNTWRAERTLDLHGYSEKEAHAALTQLLEQAVVLKLRRLKIITGCGQGVLRARVPSWLLSMGTLISQIHPLNTHKGVVGFYVKLKKS